MGGPLPWEAFLSDLSPSPALEGSLCIPSLPPISTTDGLGLICLTGTMFPSFLDSWSGSRDLSPSIELTSLGFSDLVLLTLAESE